MERKRRSWWAEQGVLEREGAAGVNALLHPGWLPVIPAPSSFRALPSGLLRGAELGRLHRNTPMQLAEARALHTGCGAGGLRLGQVLGCWELGSGATGATATQGECQARVLGSTGKVLVGASCSVVSASPSVPYKSLFFIMLPLHFLFQKSHPLVFSLIFAFNETAL